MNSIEFQLRKHSEGWRSDEVRVVIDGRDLIDLLSEHEARFAEAEVPQPIAGGYSGLPPAVALPPSRHLYGEPKPIYEYDRKVEVLSCGECGEPGCWPLVCEILVAARTITWQRFEQAQRTGEFGDAAWQYDDFGPFEFERAEYEGGLSLLAAGAV
jgi:hypothetical protein